MQLLYQEVNFIYFFQVRKNGFFLALKLKIKPNIFHFSLWKAILFSDTRDLNHRLKYLEPRTNVTKVLNPLDAAVFIFLINEIKSVFA